MPNADQQIARFHLNRVINDDAYELFTEHPWFWEGARWNELLFSITAHIGSTDEAAVRVLIAELDELGLIELKELAALPRAADGVLNTTSPGYLTLAQTMERYAMGESQVRRTITAFSDAAAALQQGFGGKVQKYFRHYGEQMLAEIGQNFKFQDLTDEEVGNAFTEWFQNCLNMPLSMRDADTRKFCEANGTTIEALFEAADDADINLAYLDDVTQAAVHAAPSDAQATLDENGDG